VGEWLIACVAWAVRKAKTASPTLGWPFLRDASGPRGAGPNARIQLGIGRRCDSAAGLEVHRDIANRLILFNQLGDRVDLALVHG